MAPDRRRAWALDIGMETVTDIAGALQRIADGLPSVQTCRDGPGTIHCLPQRARSA